MKSSVGSSISDLSRQKELCKDKDTMKMTQSQDYKEKGRKMRRAKRVVGHQHTHYENSRKGREYLKKEELKTSQI